jgi:hypothetical protein
MSASGTVKAIDTLIALMSASMRLSQLIQKAQTEGRDVTDVELAELREESRSLANEFLSL